MFVEIDAPWWSPVPDKKWVWPLGEKEWPIGGSFGFLASVDYVFGSKSWPTVEFKPAEFQADKFMSDLYDDKAKDKSGEHAEQKGAWHEKNSEAAEPPKPGEGKGAPPTGKPLPAKGEAKAAPPPAAKSKGKPADPNAKTADGKTVKELQDKAAAHGKKPPAPAAAGKGADSKGSAKTGSSGEEHDKKLAEGLRALDALTARYARDGATKDEIVTGVKSVRRKFTIFKSIEVIDGGNTWDYEYVANPGTKQGAKKSTVKGASGPNQKILGITTSPGITSRQGNLERDQGALTANLGGPVANHAAHHLIPVSTASQALLMKAGAEAGYDINRAGNGVMLPTDVATAKKVKSRCTGVGILRILRHGARYAGGPKEQAARGAQAASKPWSEVKLLGAIGRVESTLKQRLLNLKDPLELQSMDKLKP